MDHELHEVVLRVNGEEHTVTVSSNETLLVTLRRALNLMSVRYTCTMGMCGACTVLVDGLPISSCLSLTVLNEGKEITTTEGLTAEDGTLDPIQEAFLKYGAFQCSYCTPAMILTVKGLLNENPQPTRDEVRDYMAGNLCRCGAYPHILDAVMSLTSSSSSS